jgi:hypothetical protein
MTAIIMMLGLIQQRKIIIEDKKESKRSNPDVKMKRIRLEMKCPNSISLFETSVTKQILYLNTFKASISASISSFEL